MRTTACPAPGDRSGTSSRLITSGSPRSWTPIASMVGSLIRRIDVTIVATEPAPPMHSTLHLCATDAFARRSAASVWISVRSRCISLQPYHSA